MSFKYVRDTITKFYCKNRKTYTVVLLIFIFSEPVSSRQYQIRTTTGVIRSPTRAECLLDRNPSLIDSHWRIWNISVPDDKALYIHFLKFQGFQKTSCLAAAVRVISEKRRYVKKFCASEEADDYMEKDVHVNTTITFHSPNCFEVFALKFALVDVNIRVESHVPIAVGENVLFEVKLLRVPVLKVEIVCELLFGDGYNEIVLSLPAKIRHVYRIGGAFRFSISCSKDHWLGDLSSHGSIIVDANLSTNALNLQYVEGPAYEYVSDSAVLQFKHNPTSPFIYHLIIGGDSYRNLGSVTNPRATRFHIELKRKMQIHSGSGVRPFTIILENSVSWISYTWNFTTYKKLKDFQIFTDIFVTISPGLYDINFKIKEGYPANIKVSLIRHDSIFDIIDTYHSFCSYECNIPWKIKAKAPPYFKYKKSNDDNKFRIAGGAWNRISQITGDWGPFEILPQIYDIFVATTGPAYVGKESELNIFGLTDIGEFDVSIYYNYDPRPGYTQFHGASDFWLFDVKESTFRPDHTFSVPFNSRFFQRETGLIIFKHAGRQKVSVTFKNPDVDQKLTVTYEIFVRSEFACMQKVIVRDGNRYGWFTNALNLVNRIVLSARLQIATQNDIRKCLQYYRLVYRWEAYSVKHSYEMPDENNFVQLRGDVSRPKVLIETNYLSPGLYVIICIVTSIDTSSKEQEEEVDFTLIEVQKPKLDFQIKGGSKRVIGTNTKVIKFETSLLNDIKDNGNLTIHWFCATSRGDLPEDVRIARLLKQGDCFTRQKQLYISSGETMEFSPHLLTRSEFYCIRAYASKNGFESSYADQILVYLSRKAPHINLSCLNNCEKYLSSHLPLLVQLQCESCVSSRWVLQDFNETKLDHCNDKKYCRLNESLVQNIRTSYNNYLTVTGVDARGRKASITLRFGLKTTPRNGYCDFTYIERIHAKTVVSMSCEGYFDRNDPLFYKFYLLDEEKRNPLLQYGYDASFNSFTVGVLHSKVVQFFIKICNAIDSCTSQTISAEILRLGFDVDVNEEIHFDLATQDLQSLVQTLAGHDDKTTIPYNSITKVVEEMGKVNIDTMETAKQICDVLNHVSNQTHLLDPRAKNLMWIHLFEVRKFLISTKEEDIFEYTLLLTSCISAASHILQAESRKTITGEDFKRITSFTRLLKDTLLPGESSTTLHASGISASFIKFSNSDRMPVNNSEIQQLQSINADGIINVETHKFDGSIINFNTPTHKVEEVISISIQSEGETAVSLYNDEDTQFLTTSFALPQSKLHYSTAVLNVSQMCVGEYLAYRANANIEFTIDVDGNEDIRGSIFKMSLEDLNTINYLWELKVILKSKPDPENRDRRSVYLEKRFSTKERFYDWSIPLTELPHSGANYTILMEGGVLRDYNDTKVFEFRTLIYAVDCYYWDDNIVNWNDDRCKASSKLPPSEMRCECDYFPVNPQLFTVFGSNTTQSPTFYATQMQVYSQNQIEEVVPETIVINPLLIVFLVFIIGGYVYLMRWAFAKDIEIGKQGFIIDCKDNSPFETYRYLVTIYTGWRLHSGTTATVSIRLRGRKEKSKVHVLQTPEDIVLKTVSVQAFLITTYTNIGDIRSVHLWHDGGGSSPSWRVQRMSVRDMETDECWFINVNTHLEKGIDYSFKPAHHSELDTLTGRLGIKWETNCKNRHLWCSLYAMQPWHLKEMNRAQTLSIGLLQLILVLLATMTSYEALREDPCTDNKNATLWFIFENGIKHGLFVFPLLFLIHGLFRATHKHISSMKGTGEDEVKPKPEKALLSLVAESSKKDSEESSSSSSETMQSESSRTGMEGGTNEVTTKSLVERLAVLECKKTLYKQSFTPTNEVAFHNHKQSMHLNLKHYQAALRTIDNFKNPHITIKDSAVFPKEAKSKCVTIREPTPLEVRLHGLTYFLTNVRPQVGIQVTECDIDQTTKDTSDFSTEFITKCYTTTNKPSDSLGCSTSCDFKAAESAFASSTFIEAPEYNSDENQEPKLIYHNTVFPSAGQTEKDLHPTDSVYKEIVDKETTNPFLPWFFTYIMWGLWACFSSIALVICVLYGWKFRTLKTLKWFTSALIAFIEAAVFFETLIIALATLIMCVAVPKQDIYDWIPPINHPILLRYVSHMVTERKRQKRERKRNPAYCQPGHERASSSCS